MPVTTRSMNRLLSTAQAPESQPYFNPAKTIQQPPRTPESLTLKRLDHPNGARSPNKKTQKRSHTPQDPNNKTPPQDPGKKEQLQTITRPHLPSSTLSNATKAFWPCQKCHCHDGIFEDLVDTCYACGHSMFDHEPHHHDPWYHGCDYISERDELVTSILKSARQLGAVVIRATPMIGSSTLLKLLGHRITYQELDLEPVYIMWKSRKTRNGLSCQQYLTQEETEWRERNAKSRPRNPAARTIYLIDKAQDSLEAGLWSILKNYHNTEGKDLFVFICVNGAAGISYISDRLIQSQTQLEHSLQHFELHPSMSRSICMLFKREETDTMLRKFALYHKCHLENGVVEYLHGTTGGHPGMLGLLLSHIRRISQKTSVPIPQMLSPEFIHESIIQHKDSFVEWLDYWGRGIWSPQCERDIQRYLILPELSDLRFLDIEKALREVAVQPHGLTRQQQDFDAYAFCHEMGLLHTEHPEPWSEQTKFTFASPLHRRIAYRCLFPGEEPDAILKDLGLQQICINAIARFSPGALQNRQYSQSSGSWGIPEAAFQNELYCCLHRELHYLPILSEYSHTKDGRIDFYVSDQKWGIEVLQCGSNVEIAKHIARFAYGGKYQRWEIMDDYIILNFCPRATLREVKVEDKKIKSHLFHVVIEPEELTAEIYTHDMQLYKTWSLSEGRQRVNTDFYGFDDPIPNTTNGGVLLHEPTQRREGTTVEIEEIKRDMERQMEEKEREREERERERERQMKREMEREIERRVEEREREREKIRLQREQEEDREEIAQEQDKPVLGRDRKRKT